MAIIQNPPGSIVRAFSPGLPATLAEALALYSADLPDCATALALATHAQQLTALGIDTTEAVLALNAAEIAAASLGTQWVYMFAANGVGTLVGTKKTAVTLITVNPGPVVNIAAFFDLLVDPAGAGDAQRLQFNDFIAADHATLTYGI